MKLHALAWCALALGLLGAPGITGCGRGADTGAPATTSQPAVASATPLAAASLPALATTTASGELPAGSLRDLRDLAATLGPDLLRTFHNPNGVTIRMMDMTNKTEDMPGRDMSIYTVKLTNLLNTGTTSDRLLFVEQAALLNMQANPAGGTPTTTGFISQFTLSSEVRSMSNGRTTYYLLTFHLTSFTTGAQVWSSSYELQALN